MNTQKEENPLGFALVGEGYSTFRWTTGMEVLYGLQGVCRVHIGGGVRLLHPNELLVINPFEIYSIELEQGACLMSLTFPRELLKIAGFPLRSHRISCLPSMQSGQQAVWEALKTKYAQLFQLYLRVEQVDLSRLAGHGVHFVGYLMEHCLQPLPPDGGHNNEQVVQRLQSILAYIHDNMHSGLSLSSVARHAFISPNYLSRFFKKHLHTTFTDYLSMVRLQQGAKQLESSRHSVTQIAMEAGFPNVNAFINTFRTRYGLTPGQYRKKAQQGQTAKQATPAFADKADLLLPLLERNLLTEDGEKTEAEYRSAEVDTGTVGQTLAHTWRRLLNIGYAKEGLLAGVQQRIRQVQREIGFEYVRFHGIFDADMHVCSLDENGGLQFDFTCVDLLFDFLLEQGLRPYLELSFVPPVLGDDSMRLLDRVSLFMLPRDLDSWRKLVRETLLHLAARYGLEEMRQWRFTAIPINMAILKHATFAEYYTFYQTTWETVKGVDTELRFGGPGSYASAVWEEDTMERFLQYACAQSCPPDFVCLQAYPYQSIDLNSDFLRFITSHQEAPSVLSEDEAFIAHLLERLRALLERQGLAQCKIVLEEWNSTLWQRDISGDTCYKSAYILKTICENYDEAEAFGYWTLSDLIEERVSPKSVFHGGYGLFTCEGIAKSGYWALWLLRHAGDTLVARGEGWFVTKSGRGLQVFLYHYAHYDRLFRYRYRIMKDPREAYSVFIQKSDLHMALRLRGLQPGPYRVQRYAVSRSEGSAFDKWLQMGAPPSLRREEAGYLAEVSRPGYRVQEMRLGETFTLEERLQPLEIKAILITPQF